MNFSEGWKSFLFCPHFPSLVKMAEEMYRLNVHARNVGHHPIVDQIYALKDEMIKYLYQHGYCVDVKLHEQKRMCRTCDGTGVFWTGEKCWKCNNGVYAVTELYALRFCIDGRRYAWHQLKKLVSYEITLTDDERGEWREPLPAPEIVSLSEAWRGCCLVWWGLLWRGVWVPLLLFPMTKLYLSAKLSGLWNKERSPS